MVRSKKTIFDVNVALANLEFHVHAASFVGSVMVSSRREIICSRTYRTWENYKNLWESTTPQL